MKKIWSAIFEKGRSVHRKASVSFKSDRSIFCETRLARFYDARNERGLRMKYSFDEVIDRTGNRCAKYDERLQKFGRADVLPLWVADMDFKTAQPIIDACAAKAKEDIWGYTSRPDSYFQAVQDWQLRRKQWKPDTKLMSWSLGVVPAMSAILHIFSDPQDRILIQTPVYSEFYDIVEDSGRIVVENRLLEQNGRWQIDFDDFARKARTCRIFQLCSPQNPVGRVWSRDELTRMAQICIENDVLIVSDEIHSDLIFNGCRHIPTASLSEDIGRHVITCTSVSKTFNLAGMQASTTIFPDAKKKERFDRFWGAMDIHRNNAFSSVAMEASYRHGEEWLDQLLFNLQGNFDCVCDFCKKWIPQIRPNHPDATYLLWLDCRDLHLSDDALRDFFIERAERRAIV